MGKVENLFGTYSRPDLEFVRGEGVRLFDARGRDWLDCTAGIAVNALGHGHPHLVEKLREAAGGIWHLSNVFRIPGQEELARRLCEATFADRVFFANSGAEAMECAIKTARRFHHARGETERVNIITFEGAFHGRTLAMIAAGGQAKYLEGFGTPAPGFVQVPFADRQALEAAIDEQTAAILLEPVQGEGGIRPFSADELQHVRALCDRNGILLILDEIQSGMGRTGRLFAHEWAGIVPDLMAVAKGLGGGFPVGACLATEDAAAAMTVGTHGTTFGGNPLAMAVGNAVLDVVLADGFLEHVRDMGVILRQQLAEIADGYPELVEAIRGEGLMQGMKLKVPNVEVVAMMREHGVLAVPAGDNVIRFLPPLVITADELREVRARTDNAFHAYAAARQGAA